MQRNALRLQIGIQRGRILGLERHAGKSAEQSVIPRIVVGALLAVGVALVGGDTGPIWARALGLVALTFASVNIFGGFLVTQRMLGMFHRKEKR